MKAVSNRSIGLVTGVALFILAAALWVAGAMETGKVFAQSSSSSADRVEANILYQDLMFEDLKVTEHSVDYKHFPSNSTIQLEANHPGHSIAFEFPVEADAEYEIHLRPWRAPSYARYNVLIDGQLVKEVDFYGTSKELELLTILPLTRGNHTIKFEYSGKAEASSNYKMGVTELHLVGPHTVSFSSLKELDRTPGLESEFVGDALLVRSSGAEQYIEFELLIQASRAYRLRLEGMTTLSGGIAEVSLDGNVLGSIDFYGADLMKNAKLDASTPLLAGIHKLRLEVTGKHNDSDGFILLPLRVVLSLDDPATEKTVRLLESELSELEHKLESIDALISAGQADEDAELRGQSEQLSGRLAALSERSTGEVLTIKKAQALHDEAAQLSWSVRRLANFADARFAQPAASFGLAAADSMSLVYPRELPCSCYTGAPELSLAKGEYESLQAVVLAYGKLLSNVRAEVVSILDPDGEEAAESLFNAEAAPLGSVYVRKSSFYTLPATVNSPSGYEGWIPDPIRDDLDGVDVSAWDMQPYWIELYAGKEAKAGTYTITVQFSADGVAHETMEIKAKVWPFSIPDRPDLATSMTMNPVILDIVYDLADEEQFDRMHEAYIDFLETFKIEPDNIYTRTPPAVEDLLKIKEKWGLKRFNFYYIYPGWLNLDLKDPKTWQPEIDRILSEIGEAWEQYKQAGLAEYAYIYGFDESRGDQLKLAVEVFRQIKERFPDLTIMSTLMDRTLGIQSGMVGLVDIWVPGVEQFDRNAKEQAQNRGDEVYWYTHVSVRDPHPNWFNGYVPSDTRILLGPMSHKMGVDGFLYYNITRWLYQGPMKDGIFSSWDARTWNDASGDGSLFYPGANGPLASQRIHNFRDGMEDYNLMNKLKAYISLAEGKNTVLAASARELLQADSVVTNQTSFTDDPAVYRTWRYEVSSMIVQLEALAAQSQLEAYMASGDVKQPLESQLTNHLRQALFHHESGKKDQALHSMELFVTHMNNAAHADQISLEAKAVMAEHAQNLMEQWK